MRRLIGALAGAVLIGTVSAGLVLALNYDGEDYCQDYPAWPNGTYLGQMHPYHSNFYAGFAERRGWDPCVTWALDQRNSAARGLRELGYTVVEPAGGSPALTSTPTPEPAPTPPPVPAQTAKATTTWVLDTSVFDEATGAKRYIALAAQNRRVLAVRCQDNLIDTIVYFGEDAHISGDINGLVATQWRFDANPTISGVWGTATDKQFIFSGAAVAMARQIFESSRFRIQATDLLSGNQYLADFTLDGRSDPNHPVRRVFSECGLTIGESYEGEAFCRDTPAWPNGTYLGQMHPFHADFYTGFAERRGWEPCETWATDQRNSAIRGLRALGYTVYK